MPAIRTRVIAFGLFLALMAAAAHPRADTVDRAVSRAFLTLLVGEEAELAGAMALVESTWNPSYLPMALEVMRLSRNQGVAAAFMRIMEAETGGDHGYDLTEWQRAMWNAPEVRHPRYAAFKSALYSPHRPALRGVLRRGGRAAHPARRDRLGRRPAGRHPPAPEPEDARRRRCRLPRGRARRVRDLGRRRGAGVPQTHPRLARDVRRHRRRGAGRGRVLHALRHRHPLPYRARRGEPRAWDERLPLPLEQAHVRPGHPVALEPRCGARRSWGRSSGRASRSSAAPW